MDDDEVEGDEPVCWGLEPELPILLIVEEDTDLHWLVDLVDEVSPSSFDTISSDCLLLLSCSVEGVKLLTDRCMSLVEEDGD